MYKYYINIIFILHLQNLFIYLCLPSLGLAITLAIYNFIINSKKGKTMKTKIVAISIAALVATSSLYAFGGPRDFKDCSPSKGSMFFGHTKGFDSSANLRAVMSIISEMDLSSEQWSKIRKVMFNLKEERFDKVDDSKISVVLDKDGNFDKTNFIKSRTDFSKEMIESQASAFENILSVLDDAQRKTLATKLK